MSGMELLAEEFLAAIFRGVRCFFSWRVVVFSFLTFGVELAGAVTLRLDDVDEVSRHDSSTLLIPLTGFLEPDDDSVEGFADSGFENFVKSEFARFVVKAVGPRGADFFAVARVGRSSRRGRTEDLAPDETNPWWFDLCAAPKWFKEFCQVAQNLSS